MRRKGKIAVILCTVACARAAQDIRENSEHFYFYFKESRSLTIDPIRLAIHFRGSSVNQPPGPFVPTTTQFPVAEASSIGIPGWQLLTYAGRSRASEEDDIAIRLRMNELPDSPDVEFVSPVFVGSDGGPVIVTPRILVRFDLTATDVASAERMLSELGIGEIVAREWGGMPGAFLVSSPRTNGLDVLDDANRLARLPEVRFAEPDMIFTGGSTFIPNDPGFANCWGLHNTGQYEGLPDFDIDAPEAWDVTVGDPGVIIVVIDVGVQQDHPDIHQILGTDVTSDPSTSGGPVNSFDRHGTVVAGAITATINNGAGTVGVAPGCVTASARTFIGISDQGKWITEIGWTVESLAWAESIGARVTNNSNFYGFQSSAIADKYAQTRENGMVHFASAGNQAVASLEYPASLPAVRAVGAVQNAGGLAYFSNFGPDLDFVAPGTDIFTTDRTGSEGYTLGAYVFVSGTSLSSAFASGVAALFISTHPQANAHVIEEGLRLTAMDLGQPGRDNLFGWGMVNAASAVAWDGDCGVVSTPLPEPDAVNKNRYLSFRPDSSGRRAAIRMRVLDVPSSFESIEGQSFWVGEPSVRTDSVSPPTTFTVAFLECEPMYRAWNLAETLHVTGRAIVPSSVYAVQMIYESCDRNQEEDYSPALVIQTARWGDVVPPFNPADSRSQPDFLDVSAVVNRFRSAPGAPGTASADLDPALPNQTVDFTDIAMVVDAFKGFGYPWTASPCP